MLKIIRPSLRRRTKNPARFRVSKVPRTSWAQTLILIRRRLTHRKMMKARASSSRRHSQTSLIQRTPFPSVAVVSQPGATTAVRERLLLRALSRTSRPPNLLKIISEQIYTRNIKLSTTPSVNSMRSLQMPNKLRA